MKQLGIILALLLIAGGVYFLVVKDKQVEAPDNNDGDQTATTTPDENATTTPDNDDEQSNNDNDDEVAPGVAYCTDLKANIAGSENWHIITTTVDGAELSSGDQLSGCVYSVDESYGNWAPFEGQVGSYELIASDSTVLAQGPLPTVGNWMELGLANQPMKYETALDFDASGYSEGTLTLRNENASGEPSRDEEVTIDVVFN